MEGAGAKPRAILLLSVEATARKAAADRDAALIAMVQVVQLVSWRAFF